MTNDDLSKLLGGYFRHVVARNSENSVYAAINGKGKPIKNPFTGDTTLSYKAPKSLVNLAELLKKHKLDKDEKFVKALSEAISDITEAPVSYVLEELRVFEENGDGGPDPSFELKLHDSEVANMKLVLQGFKKSGTRP